MPVKNEPSSKLRNEDDYGKQFNTIHRHNYLRITALQQGLRNGSNTVMKVYNTIMNVYI